jgi:hypothetical protein
MTFHCLAAGRNKVVCGLFAVVLALGATAVDAAYLFPFDRDLLLDAAPMRPVKRVPILNVAPDGAATIDLWCKTVRGFVQLSGDGIRIEAGPLPDALP